MYIFLFFNFHISFPSNAAVDFLMKSYQEGSLQKKTGADLQDPICMSPTLLSNCTLFFRQALLNISSSIR